MQIGLITGGVVLLVAFFVMIHFARPKDGVAKRIATGKIGDAYAYLLTVLLAAGVSCIIAALTQWSGPALQG